MVAFNQSARDSARKTDFTMISEVLELYHIDESWYPKPDSAVDILYEWLLVWSQWIFWEKVTRSVKKFWQDIPSDPMYDVQYSYSITKKGNEYQIASILESVDAGSIFDRWDIGYVEWTYNDLMVKVRWSGIDYYIASPSIIVNDTSYTDLMDILQGDRLAYDDWINLPWSYASVTNTNKGNGVFLSNPLIFSGSINDIKQAAAVDSFVETLEDIYEATPLVTRGKYKEIFDAMSPEVIQLFLQKNYSIPFINLSN